MSEESVVTREEIEESARKHGKEHGWTSEEIEALVQLVKQNCGEFEPSCMLDWPCQFDRPTRKQ